MLKQFRHYFGLEKIAGLVTPAPASRGRAGTTTRRVAFRISFAGGTP